ncbi:DUF998 domain-containing protein [Actinoplanes solisilvae]|uniref:DUF998 domain-containing protein n=1 Tax=Actinoplanes solisilvae TaxID=2486853 RepID=UPI0013E3D150|nr:DUF998 domain-containing protein [Actinoplanes solisilvae]
MRALPAIAATQMIVFVTVAGSVRPGYDPARNWVSQLSLGPGGGWATANMICCGLLLMLGGRAGRRHPGPGGGAGPRLVAWCGFCLVVLAVLPTDPGIGYPPYVAPAHTTIGFAHQVVAVVLAVSGVAAAAVAGCDAGLARAGLIVAAIMAVSFTAATVLVLLDDAGVLPGNPSGLLERVALFLGLAWIGALGLRTRRPSDPEAADSTDRCRSRATLAAGSARSDPRDPR